jgi:hypothetical protein
VFLWEDGRTIDLNAFIPRGVNATLSMGAQMSVEIAVEALEVVE